MGRGTGAGRGAEAVELMFGLCQTKFTDREQVRLQNRTKHQIHAEISTTLKKLAVFVCVFYALLYMSCMVLSVALDSSIDGKEPFDGEACDMSTDRGKVVGISTVAALTLMIVPAIFIIKEGDSKVHDRVWDFAITICVLHLILTLAVGGMPEGQWWGVLIGGGVLLGVGGYFASNKYWGMMAQKRLDDKVNALNAST